ncbi:MAG: hypothetical protein EXX96DRAFT_590002 [Benjaminiella poitrasii]|nr:MAG: hypothetical protein EXX96DRAFT_590002 [Benjaminiella poitrasii]
MMYIRAYAACCVMSVLCICFFFNSEKKEIVISIPFTSIYTIFFLQIIKERICLHCNKSLAVTRFRTFLQACLAQKV